MSKKNKKTKLSNTGVLATNRKARHDYTILDTWECGLVLQGTEIKALRDGRANIAADGTASRARARSGSRLSGAIRRTSAANRASPAARSAMRSAGSSSPIDNRTP